MAKSGVSVPGLGPSIWVTRDYAARSNCNQHSPAVPGTMGSLHNIPDRSMSAADAFYRHQVSPNAAGGQDTAKKAPAEAVRLLHHFWSSSFREADAVPKLRTARL
jgi:hypothetical protein